MCWLQDVLASLKRLVTLNEQLKKQESEFKAGCKAQMKCAPPPPPRIFVLGAGTNLK